MLTTGPRVVIGRLASRHRDHVGFLSEELYEASAVVLASAVVVAGSDEGCGKRLGGFLAESRDGSLEARQVVRTGPFDDFGAHSYQHFAITDDAVIVFFGHDILHQGGPQKASVLRSELASLLA